MISAFYLALLATIYLGLTFYVISIRRSKLVSLGDGNHPPLQKAVRVHGNFIEFTPLFVIMLYFAEIQNLPVIYLHLLGIAFVAGRISHIIGILKQKTLMKLRVAGMLLTLTSYLVLIPVLLFKNFALIF